MNPSSIPFDKHGYLIPYECLEINLESLQIHFVDNFPKSTTRKPLFENYLRFIYRFQDEVFPFFEQWINGSFVSQKENPKDIDIITFLDYEIYEKRGEKILDKFWTFSLEDEGIDSYIVKEYPKNHNLFNEFINLRKEWNFRYSHAKPNNQEEVYSKGYLKINFEK